MKNKIIYYIFIFLFLLLTSAPFWGMFFHKNSDLKEKRNLERFNKISGIYSLNSFLVDNHGFRDKFSNLCIDIYLKILNESPIPGQVILGKEDWLFLGDGSQYNYSYSSSLGVIDYNKQITKSISQNIHSIKLFCDSIGCKFYFVIAPDKSFIYDEYMVTKPNKTLRLKDIIIAELENEYGIQTVDLYPIIKQQKVKDILYYKNDTHWNDYGGLIATEYFTQEIKKDYNINPVIESNFKIIKSKKTSSDGDLASMLQLSKYDNYFEVTNKISLSIEETIIETNYEFGNLINVKNQTSSNNIKAIVFRDSFFTAMYNPFMSSLREASFFRTYIFDKDRVNKEISRMGKPDFLIYEVVDRNLYDIGYK